MTRRTLRPPGLALLMFALAGASPLHGQDPPPDPFIDCEAALERAPQDPQTGDCFYLAARRSGAIGIGEAEQRLRRYLRQRARTPSLEYALARVLHVKSGTTPEVESLYRNAIDGFADRGQRAAEVQARLSLDFFLRSSQRFDEAAQVLEQARTIAEAVAEEDPHLEARVLVQQANSLRSRGHDLDFAYSLAQRAEGIVFPDGPEDYQNRCLDALAMVSYDLGRLEETWSFRRRMLERALASGDKSAEAFARLNLAVIYEALPRRGEAARQEYLRLLEEAYDAAISAGDSRSQAMLLLRLGRLAPGPEGRGYLERCTEIARRRRDADLQGRCLQALAWNQVGSDPQEALELLGQALDSALDSVTPQTIFSGFPDHLSVLWAALPRDEALSGSMVLLDLLEELRELQGSGSGRARLQGAWIGVYNLLSGLLLGGHEIETPGVAEPSRQDLERAFHVTERRRARVLLEEMASTAAPLPEAARPLSDELAEVRAAKTRLLRRHFTAPRENRKLAEVELRDLERRARELQQQISRIAPSSNRMATDALATLEDVESSLADNEALLSYQVGFWETIRGDFHGGAWLWVTTRGGTRVYPLPGQDELEDGVEMVLGLPDPGAADKALAALSRKLVAPALDELHTAVDTLVVVPDGGLHLLPLGLLRTGDGDPLVESYRISVVPSATLWLQWRRDPAARAEEPALALADPALSTAAQARERAAVRSWQLDQVDALAPLPFARREGRTVTRRLGGKLLVGAGASETAVKQLRLARFSVIHFATHAVVFEDNPGRSAVLLAAGSDAEDGWLQPHEIVELELDGQLVVLASCDSAGGELLRSEGVTSLARAFFQAGARTVVGSLRKLPDDQTAQLFRDFYDRLGDGASVSEALAVAQRRRLEAGAQAWEWAGLVVLGEGELVPFPGGLPRPLPLTAIGFGLVVLALGAALVLGLRRRIRG